MPLRWLTSLADFRFAVFQLAIFCAAIGTAQIRLAQISLAHAASFTTAVSKEGQTILLLDGRIEPGDSVKLALIVTTLDNQNRAVSTLYLNSPGGRGGDDNAMAALVQRFKISTIVADGAECASACFTVFAAGHKKFAGYSAQIGVHRASQSGQETEASFAATADMSKTVRELGVPPAIVGKLLLTPPDQIAWLSPGDLQSMNVTIAGMPRPPAAPAPPVVPRRLTRFKPGGLIWSEYIAEASEVSRQQFGPDHVRAACNLYTMLCSRYFTFIDSDDVRTQVTTVEDLSGNIVRRKVCKDDMSGRVWSCFDWDTLEKYHAEFGEDGQWKRKSVTGKRD